MQTANSSKRKTLRAFLGGCLAAALLSTAFAQKSEADLPRVKLQTSKGDIVVELQPEKAPRTVENFLAYVDGKHYEGTIFHRVIDGFMVQGGGFTEDFTQKPTKDPIVLESDNGLKNDRGTIAMARTMVPNSATSQFFINVANNTPLNAGPGNPGYAVFGKVVEGMDVVDLIRAVPTTSKGPHQNVPAEPVVILSATKVE